MAGKSCALRASAHHSGLRSAADRGSSAAGGVRSAAFGCGPADPCFIPARYDNRYLRRRTPVSALSWTAGSLRRPRRTCFQQHLHRDASILVAKDASRTFSRSLPIQLSLAHALIGSFGFLAAMSTRQSQQVHTMPFSAPIPAQGGRSSAG